MLTKQEIIDLLRTQTPYLATEFGVCKIGLFGSYVSGQPNEASDVDLVVEFDRPIGFRFLELADYLEVLFGRKVDLLTPAGIQSIHNKSVATNIRKNILAIT